MLTKLDGTAKGGVILGIADQLKIPVRYIGVGERVEDLRAFDPEEFVEALFEPPRSLPSRVDARRLRAAHSVAQVVDHDGKIFSCLEIFHACYSARNSRSGRKSLIFFGFLALRPLVLPLPQRQRGIMKRPAISLFVWVAIVGWAATGHAKKGGGKAAASSGRTADDSAATGKRGGRRRERRAGGRGRRATRTARRAEREPRHDRREAPRKVEEDIGGPQGGKPSDRTLTWQDIVVVPRKAFLKGGRLELAPFVGHVDQRQPHPPLRVRRRPQLLPDRRLLDRPAGAVLHQAAHRPQDELVGLQYNRTPTLNRYLYGGALNFGYVPVYGKFALFNRAIMHWEIWASAGVGATVHRGHPARPGQRLARLQEHRSDAQRRHRRPVLPVRLADAELRAARLHRPRQVRADPDPPAAGAHDPADQAKASADSALVNNVMFYAGVGIYLPTKFTYKTPR